MLPDEHDELGFAPGAAASAAGLRGAVAPGAARAGRERLGARWIDRSGGASFSVLRAQEKEARRRAVWGIIS